MTLLKILEKIFPPFEFGVYLRFVILELVTADPVGSGDTGLGCLA
jgi:hypothetical protein